MALHLLHLLSHATEISSWKKHLFPQPLGLLRLTALTELPPDGLLGCPHSQLCVTDPASALDPVGPHINGQPRGCGFSGAQRSWQRSPVDGEHFEGTQSLRGPRVPKEGEEEPLQSEGWVAWMGGSQ